MNSREVSVRRNYNRSPRVVAPPRSALSGGSSIVDPPYFSDEDRTRSPLNTAKTLKDPQWLSSFRVRLDAILRDKKGLESLQRFCDSEHSEELILFWSAVDQLQQWCMTRNTNLRQSQSDQMTIVVHPNRKTVHMVPASSAPSALCTDANAVEPESLRSESLKPTSSARADTKEREPEPWRNEFKHPMELRLIAPTESGNSPSPEAAGGAPARRLLTPHKPNTGSVRRLKEEQQTSKQDGQAQEPGPNTYVEVLKQKAFKIYDEFIREKARFEITIQGDLREELKSVFEEPAFNWESISQSLSKAKLNVKISMENDTLLRFYISYEYGEWLRDMLADLGDHVLFKLQRLMPKKSVDESSTVSQSSRRTNVVDVKGMVLPAQAWSIGEAPHGTGDLPSLSEPDVIDVSLTSACADLVKNPLGAAVLASFMQTQRTGDIVLRFVHQIDDCKASPQCDAQDTTDLARLIITHFFEDSDIVTNSVCDVIPDLCDVLSTLNGQPVRLEAFDALYSKAMQYLALDVFPEFLQSQQCKDLVVIMREWRTALRAMQNVASRIKSVSRAQSAQSSRKIAPAPSNRLRSASPSKMPSPSSVAQPATADVKAVDANQRSVSDIAASIEDTPNRLPISAVLEDMEMLEHFLAFCRKEHSEEYLLFWMEVERFRQDNQRSLVKATKIWRRYLGQTPAVKSWHTVAGFTIVVDAETLKLVEATLKHCRGGQPIPANLFEQAQREAVHTMQGDVYVRFLLTPECQAFARKNGFAQKRMSCCVIL